MVIASTLNADLISSSQAREFIFDNVKSCFKLHVTLFLFLLLLLLSPHRTRDFFIGAIATIINSVVDEVFRNGETDLLESKIIFVGVRRDVDDSVEELAKERRIGSELPM